MYNYLKNCVKYLSSDNQSEFNRGQLDFLFDS